jgi:Family of unknown function (DUF6492)
MIETNGSNILIVSHLGDWTRCLSCIKSIDTHFINCNIIVIDNTETPCLIAPKLKKNNIQIVPWTRLLKSYKPCVSNQKGDGWIHQQILKLLGNKLFTEPYVIIDSDSMVLRYFKYWNDDLYRRKSNLNNFPGFVKYCSEYLKIGPVKVIRPPQIPFIMDPKQIDLLLDRWESIEAFQTWFCECPMLPSEFLLYDVWMQRDDFKIMKKLKKVFKKITFQEDENKWRQSQRVAFISSLSNIDQGLELAIRDFPAPNAACVVAHPDDCIIYGYAFIQANLEFNWKIYYLTHDASHERSKEMELFWLKRGI